jgi:hypothetical protein
MNGQEKRGSWPGVRYLEYWGIHLFKITKVGPDILLVLVVIYKNM